MSARAIRWLRDASCTRLGEWFMHTGHRAAKGVRGLLPPERREHFQLDC
jgi:hypothetical protein